MYHTTRSYSRYLFLLTSMITTPPASVLDSRLQFTYLAAAAYGLRRAGFGRFGAWGIALAAAECAGVHRF